MHESQKDLFITDKNGIKDSKRTLVVKSKDSSKKRLMPTQSCSYLRLLDPNYREKLFNLNGDQKAIFRKLTEKKIIPIRQNNVTTDYFNRELPFLQQPQKGSLVYLDSKVVNTVLDKIKFYVPPELLQNCARNPLAGKKFDSPLKKKQSIDNFKTQLATTGSLARLPKSPEKQMAHLVTLEGRGFSQSKAGESSQKIDNRREVTIPADNGQGRGLKRNRIVIANIKNNKLIKQNRQRLREASVAALQTDDLESKEEFSEQNLPFCT